MSRHLLLPGTYFFKDDKPIHAALTEESPYLMRHRHDFIEIAYVKEGEGLHYIADKIVRVSKGDLFVIPIGEDHVFQPQELMGEQPLHIINCLYCPESLGIASVFLPKEWRVYRDHNGEFKKILMRMIAELGNRKEDFKRNLILLWAQLMDILAKKPAEENLQYFEEYEVPIHKALHHMGSDFMSGMTVSETSRLVSMSTRNFQRMFKSLTGRSFIQMLQEIRIRHSCGMLQYTRMSVQSIAEMIGIYDMNYFYRLFREKYGMTPGQFRLLHPLEGTW